MRKGLGAVVQTLAKVPFFRDAGIDFDRFDRRCAWKRFDEGEICLDYEDQSSDVYFIISGEVRILIRTQSGKEVILGEMRGGQFFGELAAIDDTPRSANVTALTNAEMCIMPAAAFREVVYASPVVADRLLRLLASRIRELNARITEHSCSTSSTASIPSSCACRRRGRARRASAPCRRPRSTTCWPPASAVAASR